MGIKIQSIPSHIQEIGRDLSLDRGIRLSVSGIWMGVIHSYSKAMKVGSTLSRFLRMVRNWCLAQTTIRCAYGARIMVNLLACHSSDTPV